MKQNKYDNERFFKNYASMSRSQKGLKAAGEWSELEKFHLKKLQHFHFQINTFSKEFSGNFLEVFRDV